MRPALSSGSRERLQVLGGVTLAEDEAILFDAAIHPAVYWKAVAVLIFAVVLLIPAAPLAVFMACVGLFMLGLAFLTQRFLLLTATSRRIFMRSGILYVDLIEQHYSQIESVELGITPIGQIFGYGSVILTGTGQRRIIVPFVTNAHEFRRVVNEKMLEREERGA